MKFKNLTKPQQKWVQEFYYDWESGDATVKYEILKSDNILILRALSRKKLINLDETFENFMLTNLGIELMLEVDMIMDMDHALG